MYDIYQAQPQHAAEICALLIRSITEVCARDHQNDQSVILAWLENKTDENVKQWLQSTNIGFVCLDKHVIVGFILMSAEGEILLNYVLPEYIGKGVGSSLLQRVESMAIQRRLDFLSVNSTTTACSFYLQKGFMPSCGTKQGDHLVSYPMIKKLK